MIFFFFAKLTLPRRWKSKIKLRRPGADLGGGTFFSSGIRPPADPKGPPLYYFEISIFTDGP